jgi:hypothetical protein
MSQPLKEHDMRIPAFTMAASLVLLAAPAFAQSGSMTGSATDQNQNSNSSYTNPGYSTNSMTGRYNQQGATNYSNQGTGTYNQQYGSNNSSNGWNKGGNVTSNTRDRIRASLQQSGFTNVSVVPEAFVIHAVSPDGSRIVMLLRPDELTGVVEQTGSSTTPGNWNNQSSSMNGGSNNWNSGTNTDNGTNR